MKRIISFGLLLALTSCSGVPGRRLNLDEYIAPSSTVQYFLPDIPSWANTSEEGKCLRKHPIRYLNFEKLGKSFLFSQEQLLSLQQMFNIERMKILEGRRFGTLGLKEEEALFYETADRVRSNIRLLIRPSFPRSHVVWIDPFITKEKDRRILKRLLEDDHFQKGYPIFASLCLSYREAHDFAAAVAGDLSVKIISAEFLTHYTKDASLTYRPALYIGPLFEKKGLKLFLYTPTVAPDSLKGPFTKVHVFK